MGCAGWPVAGVGVGVALAPLQTCVSKPSLHSVLFFHFFWKSEMNLSSAFCWFCDASVCWIVVFACSSDCCVAFVILSTSKT